MNRELRVVSYNIRGQRDDRAALVAVVRELAPDVLLLQEAPQRFRWRYKCAALAHSLGMVMAAGGQPGRGNLILTTLRVRVDDTWCRWYPLTPGRHLRGAAFARCSASGAGFVVASSHLATDPVERPSQAKLLKEALAEVDELVVVGADLNDEPGGAAWRALADGLLDAAGSDGAFTFSCADPRRRIDAIFVDLRIEVASYRVVDTPLARRASDHFPVLADLRLHQLGEHALGGRSDQPVASQTVSGDRAELAKLIQPLPDGTQPALNRCGVDRATRAHRASA